MDDLEAMQRAGRELEARLPAVRKEVLDRPSACPGWTVYDLVNHVIGGGHRYLLLLQGAAADDLTPTRTQDHVRPDPPAGYQRWQRPMAAAFAEPGALGRVVHHRVGDRSGLDLLRLRTLELTLHAWDLARSLGLDETLDPAVCSHLLEHCGHLVEELRGAGLYAPRRTDDGPATPQARLLRETGRG